MKTRLVLVGLSLFCASLVAAPVAAQVYTGRIDVTIKDGTGAVLPGVTVEAVGPQTDVAVTDTQGGVHFVNLAPGRYTVTAKLSGFTDYRNENVPVNAGSIVPLVVTLGVGGMSERVEVTEETPVIETKRQTVSTNVNLDELQNIPSARDPWVVLQTIPGIIVDRVNVGGAESGQQSNYQAKGANPDQNTWNMDGISITDMGSLGASPTYYDFDMFQEMQVTTGGADPANATPGVQLNFVLRGGTSKWRGTTRYYFENNSLQSDNVSSDLFGQIASYNRVGEYKDWGFEGGGPIIPRRLFAWGAYGKTEPEINVFSFDSDLNDYAQIARDATTLENISAKITGELSPKTRANFTYFRGNKLKFGRGASGFRPDETTYNQDGPTDLYKAEVTQTIGTNLFLVGRYAHTKNGFSLEPRGGRDVQSYRDDATVYHGSYGWFQTLRPQHNVSLEGNKFKGRHDLKFGFGWKKASVTSESGWPGNGVRTYHRGYPNMQARVVRDWSLAGEGKYWNAYLGDTISFDRLTLNAGVRWDRAASSVAPASVPASPALPSLLPALDAPAVENAIVYNNVTPRVGFTYAVTRLTQDDRARQLRGIRFAARFEPLAADRLRDPVLLVCLLRGGGHERQSHRRPQRVHHLPGSGWIRSGQPPRRKPRSYRRLQLAADPRAPVRGRARARQELRRRRQRHVAALHRLQLAELSRRHRGGLHPGGRLQRHGAGDRQLQRALLPCERETRCQTTWDNSSRRVPTTTSVISGSRFPRPSGWPTGG